MQRLSRESWATVIDIYTVVLDVYVGVENWRVRLEVHIVKPEQEHPLPGSCIFSDLISHLKHSSRLPSYEKLEVKHLKFEAANSIPARLAVRRAARVKVVVA